MRKANAPERTLEGKYSRKDSESHPVLQAHLLHEAEAASGPSLSPSAFPEVDFMVTERLLHPRSEHMALWFNIEVLLPFLPLHFQLPRQSST